MFDWITPNLGVTVIDGLAMGGLLFLLGVGLTLIFGLMNTLNLAHGAAYMAGGYLAFLVIGSGSVSIATFVLVAVGLILLGLLMGTGLAAALRTLGNRGHLDQALLTLGLGVLLSETLLTVIGRGFHSIAAPGFLAGQTTLFGLSYPLYRLAIIVVSVVVATVTYLVFERTRAGNLARATVDDPEMVAALGVNVGRVRMAVIAAGTALAMLAGLLGAPLLNLRPGIDAEILVLSLIVVVVGGLGSIKGAAVGALIIGQVQTLGVSLFPGAAAYALFGALALVLLVRPSGLFGKVHA